MKTLRIILYSQIFLFFAWAGWLLASHAGAREIWLETTPVAPRSLIGTYVALGYPMENPATFDSGGCAGQSVVYVRFETHDYSTVKTAKGDVPVYAATACSPVKGGDGVWVRGRRIGDRIDYGISRFYINEDSPLRNARSGSVLAKVSVNSEGDMRLLDLAAK